LDALWPDGSVDVFLRSKKEKERLSSRGEELKIKKQDSITKEPQGRPISPTMEFLRNPSSPTTESALSSESKHSRLIAVRLIPIPY
jgi:hypothetical protein